MIPRIANKIEQIRRDMRSVTLEKSHEAIENVNHAFVGYTSAAPVERFFDMKDTANEIMALMKELVDFARELAADGKHGAGNPCDAADEHEPDDVVMSGEIEEMASRNQE
jgi:hypothetical protein